MNITKTSTLCCLLALVSLALCGCEKKVDENKPVTEITAETQEMSVEKLKSMAMTYKDAIVAKKGDIEKIASQLKDIPLTEMLGEEAKGLKAEIDALNKSVSALKERFDVYYDKLKKDGGDLSDLKI